MQDSNMPISKKPYLVRAMYEWCCDSGYTPHIVVAIDENCRVPMQYVQDGVIVLNVGMKAASKLHIGNEWVEFHARFSGVSHHIWVPVACITNVFARETRDGMSFEVEEYQPDQADSSSANKAEKAEDKAEKPAGVVRPTLS